MRAVDRIAEKFAQTVLVAPLEPASNLDKLRELTARLNELETERTIVLTKLHFERLQLLAIFNGIDQPIYVLNTDTWEILFANSAMLEIYGEDVLDRKCYEVFHSRTTPCDTCPYPELSADAEDPLVTDHYYENQGKWYHCISRRIHWPVLGNSHSAVFTLALDITEAKEATAALSEQESLYRTLVDTSPDAVTMTDLDARITFVSDQTLELHGFGTKEGLLGKDAFDLIAPEDRERAKQNMLATSAQGIVRNVTYAMLRRDGSRFTGVLSASVVNDSEGNPKAFIATTREISE